MTAPASLFHQELAKRGLRWEKATGCPRERTVQRKIEVARTVRATPAPLRSSGIIARNAEWRKLYEVDGLALADIAERSTVSIECVRKTLKGMGVTMRGKGGGRTMADLIAENKRLLRETAALRGRLTTYRHRLRAYEEAA